MTLFVYICNKPDKLEEILEGFLEIGITGATIIDSLGMGHVLATEIPIFAGFQSLLSGASAYNKTIFSVIKEPEKVAADYMFDPVGSKREIDSNKVFGVSEIGNEPEIEERQKLAKKALEKIAAAKEEIIGMSTFNNEEIVRLEGEFYKIAKQMVLEGTPLCDIRTACQGSWDSPRAEELIVKTAMKMAREGVLGAKLEYLMKTSEGRQRIPPFLLLS